MRIAPLFASAVVLALGCSGGDEATESHPDAESDSSSGDASADGGVDTAKPIDASDSSVATDSGTTDATDATDATDSADAGPPTAPFAKAITGVTGDRYGGGIAIDPRDGSVVVGGSFSGATDFGGGTLTAVEVDAFVVKYDRSGKHVWSKRFGEAGNQYVSSVAIDATGAIYIGGNVSGTADFGGGPLVSKGGSDPYVAKLDSSGAHVWSKIYGDAADPQYVSGIALTPSGQLMVAGLFRGTVNLGGADLVSTGELNSFLGKLEPSGAHVWSKRFGNPPGDDFSAIATDKDGAVIVVGAVFGSIDFGGGSVAPVGSLDSFVAKFDNAGVYQWAHLYGDSSKQRGISVTTDASANILFTLRGSGTVDFGGGGTTSPGYGHWLAKLTPAGTFVWAKSFPGTGTAEEGELYVTSNPAGEALVWGDSPQAIDFGGGSLPTKGGSDVLLARFTSAGTYVASKRLGDAAEQFARALTVGPTGTVALTGWFKGTIDFGVGSITAGTGGFDVIVAQTPAP